MYNLAIDSTSLNSHVQLVCQRYSLEKVVSSECICHENLVSMVIREKLIATWFPLPTCFYSQVTISWFPLPICFYSRVTISWDFGVSAIFKEITGQRIAAIGAVINKILSCFTRVWLYPRAQNFLLSLSSC